MIDLSAIDTDELRSRMEKIFLDLDALFKYLGPEIKKIGDLRQEAQIIFDELKRRGVDTNLRKDELKPV